ncbi:glycosyl transferase [Bacteroidia bacterium]|nr:glycosyl transferase [Bacteroidia bacterium]GHV45580.1 glycosyl transferase [Bacteroidia bacterium]
MTVLICPLDWGLGHATRCVPIINNFIRQGDKVVIAASNLPMAFLKNEFPQLQFEYLPSYNVTYSKGKSQTGAMLRNIPKILSGIYAEHRWLKNFLQKNKIDTVVSDNRFGLWSKQAHCIYMTHQLMIKMPENLHFMEKLLWRIHRFFINRYNECWIPDVENSTVNFAGDLAHKFPLPQNAKFIGVLSRFSHLAGIQPNTSFSVVCIVSGVEPQRSIFEIFLLETFKNSTQKILMIQGKPQKKNQKTVNGNITVVSHLETKTLASYLVGTQHIICRSGYSTIMDLVALNCLKKAQFFPTPGQTEQEYLAKYHNNQSAR